MKKNSKQQVVIAIILTLIIIGIYLIFDPQQRLQIFSFGLAYFVTGSLIEITQKRKAQR